MIECRSVVLFRTIQNWLSGSPPGDLYKVRDSVASGTNQSPKNAELICGDLVICAPNKCCCRIHVCLHCRGTRFLISASGEHHKPHKSVVYIVD
jgi:hypothetical protein